MKLIHKQALNIYEPTEIYIPKNARFLFVKSQSNTPMIWYEFDPDEKKKERRLLRIQLTGQSFHASQDYIGTFEVKMIATNNKEDENKSFKEAILKEFIFVGHVYEEIIR